MSSGSGFGPPAFNARFFERKGGNLGGQQASYERYHQSKLANLLVSPIRADCNLAFQLVPAVCLVPDAARFLFASHLPKHLYPPPINPHRTSVPSRHSTRQFAAALHDRLSSNGRGIKSLACTPGVCATDMFVHVQSLSRPGQPADLSRVPSVEDGACAQLQCCCDPGVSSGDLLGPRGMGGPPIRIPIAPPTVLIDDESKAELWACCERAIGSPFVA